MSSKQNRGESGVGLTEEVDSVRTGTLELEGTRLLVVSLPAAPNQWPESLSPAEIDIARAVIAGQSNEAIAEARGTSPSTVANQLVEVFRKLGVQSRYELVRALAELGEESRG